MPEAILRYEFIVFICSGFSAQVSKLKSLNAKVSGFVRRFLHQPTPDAIEPVVSLSFFRSGKWIEETPFRDANSLLRILEVQRNQAVFDLMHRFLA